MRIVALIALVLVSVSIVPVYAQTPAAVPEVMPFDIPYGTSISMHQVHKAIMAAVAESHKHNWKMSILVVDPGGNLVAHATMDGTQYASIPISGQGAHRGAVSPSFRCVPDGGEHGWLAVLARPVGDDRGRTERGRISDRGRW